MPQFIIHAKDHTDDDAINRRLTSRTIHLTRMKEEKHKEVFITGGALLDNKDKMIGSVIIVSLPDEQSVWQWIEQDVYVVSKVWDDVTVTPFRVANV